MKRLADLVGQKIEDLGQILEVHPVKVGDIEVGMKGLVIRDKDSGDVKGVSVLDSNYVLLTHKELRDTFLAELRKYYDGKVSEVRKIWKNGKRYVGKFMLEDYKVSFDTAYDDTNSKDSIAPIITIKNSYDKSFAVTVEWGVYRFTCENILDRIWHGSEVVRSQHTNKLFEVDFDMELILEISKAIIRHIPKLNKIKVDVLNEIYQLSEWLNEPLLYQWMKEIRSKEVKRLNTLWHLINELTYITTHKPKVKVKTKSGVVVYKSVVPPKKFGRVYLFILDRIKSNLDPMYEEIRELIGDIPEEEIEDRIKSSFEIIT